MEEWERPPLAVPVGWFELETPAGIRACTSCQPGSVGLGVCVSNGSGGKTNKRGGGRRSRLPAAVRPFVGTLVTMKSRCIKKISTQSPTFLRLYKKLYSVSAQLYEAVKDSEAPCDLWKIPSAADEGHKHLF